MHAPILGGAGGVHGYCRRGLHTPHQAGHNAGMKALRDDVSGELLACAARLVVEDGLEYGPAKQRAARQLGLGARVAMPDNHDLEAAVREHIAIFCPEEQARALLTLREVALRWMDRLADFRPMVSGAVWHGTATAHSDIYLQLFCDDPKAAEWMLLDRRVEFHPGSVLGLRGEPVDALTVRERIPDLPHAVLIHLMIHDRDDDRGALRPDAQGRPPRGDAAALRSRMATEAGEPS